MFKLGYRAFTLADPTIMFYLNPQELTHIISAISRFVFELPSILLLTKFDTLKSGREIHLGVFAK